MIPMDGCSLAYVCLCTFFSKSACGLTTPSSTESNGSQWCAPLQILSYSYGDPEAIAVKWRSRNDSNGWMLACLRVLSHEFLLTLACLRLFAYACLLALACLRLLAYACLLTHACLRLLAYACLLTLACLRLLAYACLLTLA